MNLTGEPAEVFLTEDGTTILTLAHVRSDGPDTFKVTIAESDDLGLWIRVQRDEGPNVLLVRWDYILSLEVRERNLSPYQIRAASDAR